MTRTFLPKQLIPNGVMSDKSQTFAHKTMQECKQKMKSRYIQFSLDFG